MDLPLWANLALSPGLRTKVDPPGYIGAGAAQNGCADASLYRRLRAAGLTDCTFFPQLVAVTPEIELARVAGFEAQILATLIAEKATEWREAAAAAKADGAFFIATPHHCAVGSKPV